MNNRIWIVFTVIIASGIFQPTRLAAQDGQATRTLQAVDQAAAAAPLQLPQGISLDEPLSEDGAIAVALRNNATFQADLMALELARANLTEAGLLRNPTLSLLLPFGYKQFEMLLNWPVEVLWQRPRRVAAGKIEVDRVARDLEQHGLDFMRDVRLAYWDLASAKERVRLGEESVDLRREILTLMEARLRAGDISELEVNTARLELSRAEEQSSRWTRDEQLAHGRLRDRLGLEKAGIDFDIALPPALEIVRAEEKQLRSAGLEDLQKEALANRPDLTGAALAIEEAAARAKWEHSKLLAFSGLLSIKRGAGLDFSPRGGLLMELPIFNRNQGAISRADLEVETAGIRFLAAKERIAAEVREAHRLLQQAGESVEVYADRILPQAEEGVRLAEIGYRSGDESYLWVLEAARQLLDARLQEIDLVHGLRRAKVELERSLGRKHNANS